MVANCPEKPVAEPGNESNSAGHRVQGSPHQTRQGGRSLVHSPLQLHAAVG